MLERTHSTEDHHAWTDDPAVCQIEAAAAPDSCSQPQAHYSHCATEASRRVPARWNPQSGGSREVECHRVGGPARWNATKRGGSCEVECHTVG
jgi:hypothetical protein